ncbi:protein HEADING DATE 3B [Ananas comosus]|uniref:Protein HEADING DATE 3B n=1 Tax=Ananas comosus TaxID=4615 RepID=A0A6P5GC03_ANACO|nr:protein HEADING DATE 3B [Ananas comosus]
MKGGNEEEKSSSSAGPLFPRLHVNDADKGGGPRAPPRNKMALYEQFSIPSQRFNSQASALPLPPHATTTSAVPSTSATQGFAHERSLFASYFVPSHTPIHSSERMNCPSSNGVNASTIKTDSERRSTKQLTKGMNTGGSVAECSALGIKETNVKSSCGKKLGDEDDFRVPTFVRSGVSPHSKKDGLMRQEKLTPFDAGNPKKSCPSSNGKHLEENNNSEVNSRKEANGKSSSNQESREKLGKPSPVNKVSIDKDRTSIVNSFGKSRNGREEMYRESCGNGGTTRMKMGPRSLSNIRNISRNSNLGDDCFREGDDNNENRPLELKDAEQNDELSESSMVESLSGLEVSPDDVVGVIGPKHFWKARRAIVNQQRVFAVQVFELHRLIKVQKLIAASPHLLLEANPYLKKSSPPTKNLPAESNAKSQPQSAKQKDHVHRPKQRTEECSKDNTEGNQPLPSHENGGDSNAPHQVLSNGPSIENKPNAWCLHPPPNQWLIPVMSPSEGLIYKPYSGPCPPAGSIMAPLYPSCPPLSQPSSAGDFMNSPFNGAPALPTNYFPPFGWVNGEAKQHSISSSNMSQLNSDAFSGYLWKFHASKESEIQGSTASSPCKKAERDGRDALPLFPMAPAANESASQKSPSRSADSRRGNPARVIKVVPHNARSASASAARIFRSIQEERHQCEP